MEEFWYSIAGVVVLLLAALLATSVANHEKGDKKSKPKISKGAKGLMIIFLLFLLGAIIENCEDKKLNNNIKTEQNERFKSK